MVVFNVNDEQNVVCSIALGIDHGDDQVPEAAGSQGHVKGELLLRLGAFDGPGLELFPVASAPQNELLLVLFPFVLFPFVLLIVGMALRRMQVPADFRQSIIVAEGVVNGHGRAGFDFQFSSQNAGKPGEIVGIAHRGRFRIGGAAGCQSGRSYECGEILIDVHGIVLLCVLFQ